MCLTVPCRCVAVDGVVATVARGSETIDISLVLMEEPIAIGDWIAVQAQRYGLRRLDPDEAAEIVKLYESIAEGLLQGDGANAPA
jgi:hydrogenase maturation factor